MATMPVITWSLSDDEKLKSVTALKSVLGNEQHATQMVAAVEWMMDNIYKKRFEEMISDLDPRLKRLEEIFGEAKEAVGEMRQSLPQKMRKDRNKLDDIEEKSKDESE